MLIKRFLLVLAAALTLAACAAPLASEPDAPKAFGGEVGAAPPAPTMDQFAREEPAADAVVAYSSANAVGLAQNQAVDRLVIRNASLTLTVKDPLASAAALNTLAAELGGFVVSANVYQASVDAAGNKIMQATVSLRVPADKLDLALTRLKAEAVSVDNESLSGEDVTAQYTDLESQLRNLEAAEKQLQTIMEGAKRTEDVLTVYNQLVQVRGQIEQVKGQMKYFSEAAAMSLISVNLVPDALSQPIEVGGWKAEGVAKEAVEALVRAFQGLATAAIWLVVYALPLVLVFLVPLGLIGLAIWRRARKPKPASA